jgi:hypothetical protein
MMLPSPEGHQENSREDHRIRVCPNHHHIGNLERHRRFGAHEYRYGAAVNQCDADDEVKNLPEQQFDGTTRHPRRHRSRDRRRQRHMAFQSSSRFNLNAVQRRSKRVK